MSLKIPHNLTNLVLLMLFWRDIAAETSQGQGNVWDTVQADSLLPCMVTPFCEIFDFHKRIIYFIWIFTSTVSAAVQRWSSGRKPEERNELQKIREIVLSELQCRKMLNVQKATGKSQIYIDKVELENKWFAKKNYTVLETVFVTTTSPVQGRLNRLKARTG